MNCIITYPTWCGTVETDCFPCLKFSNLRFVSRSYLIPKASEMVRKLGFLVLSTEHHIRWSHWWLSWDICSGSWASDASSKWCRAKHLVHLNRPRPTDFSHLQSFWPEEDGLIVAAGVVCEGWSVAIMKSRTRTYIHSITSDRDHMMMLNWEDQFLIVFVFVGFCWHLFWPNWTVLEFWTIVFHLSDLCDSQPRHANWSIFHHIP